MSISAEVILERAVELGVTLTVAGDLLQVRPKSAAPANFVDDLRENKLAIIDYLRNQPRHCRACLCDDASGGAAPCPVCKGRTCRDCGDCLRASMLWREAERYSKYLDSSLDTVLNRLQRGSEWLKWELLHGRCGTELYFGMSTTWAELEEVLRTVHGFVGCIFGADQSCPAGAPVMCSRCVSTRERD